MRTPKVRVQEDLRGLGPIEIGGTQKFSYHGVIESTSTLGVTSQRVGGCRGVVRGSTQPVYDNSLETCNVVRSSSREAGFELRTREISVVLQ